MRDRSPSSLAVTIAGLVVMNLVAASASAQVIGTFRWRTEPYCNVVTLTVAQNGSVFTLNGFDEPCGGTPRLPVHGVAVVQPNASITFGLSILSVPGGTPVNLEVGINPATADGVWRDTAGNTGVMRFNPASAPGSPRPLQLLAGPIGPPGAPGQPGTNGISGHQIVESAPTTVAPGDTGAVSATCPAGKKVLGGGHRSDGFFLVNMDSAPSGDNRWLIYYRNIGPTVTSTIWAYAICAVVQ